ncbi:MAG: TMEM165/GDT1 family protein [Verrucomicrobia bacterium]|nr:TMEM165/GDT1 family protein [Leptolyngbya sp. ES-bin-22]
MDWHLLGVSFITVFLSELGDKSQIAAIALSGNSQSPRTIFLGTAAALLLASLLSVFIGESTAHFLPERLVKLAAALGFAIMAIRLLLPKADSPEAVETSPE